MSNIQSKSKQIHTNALLVLNELQLENILSQVGRIFFTGSYALDLMVWNDIDCQVVFKEEVDPLEGFMQLVKMLFQLKGIASIKLINFNENPKNGMPKGLYLGFNYHSPKLGNWKIDVWHLNDDDFKENQRFMAALSNLLTDESRELLLQWKFQLMGDSKRVPHLGSYALYQAILFEGLNNNEDIRQYLNKQGINLL